jgi:hypothetical protein
MDAGLDEHASPEGGWKRGGIAVFWRRGFNVALRGMPQYYIDVDVKEDDGFTWRFTGVYGEAQSDLKHRTWQHLRNLYDDPSLPWMCAGDFNEILFSYEKEGGRQRQQQCMDRFRETLEHCQLNDLGYEGDCFTWRNHNHIAENYIRERLDRAVANDRWGARFPTARLINGDPRHLDHRPLIITTERTVRGREYRGAACFCFEASWLEEENCGKVVKEAWRGAMEDPHQSAHDALKAMAVGLADWSYHVLGDLEKRVKKIKKRSGRVP